MSETDQIPELEVEPRAKHTTVLRLLLLVCWAIVLAKTYFLLSGRPTPGFVEYAYIVALPTVLWNLKVGLEMFGTWFYLAVLSYVGIGALLWIVRLWRRYFTDDPKAWSIELTIGTTILALNFIILIFFVGRELMAASAIKREEEKDLKFDEPPTHPSPTS